MASNTIMHEHFTAVENHVDPNLFL